MTGRKSDFTLTSLDDLFKSQEIRDEEKLSKTRDIPLSQVDDFPDHPFKVKDDEDMMQLIESIKERGIITPATVRLKDDGRYELISGHRRKRACELAGFETLRCEVVDLTKDEATILMVESNRVVTEMYENTSYSRRRGTNVEVMGPLLLSFPFKKIIIKPADNLKCFPSKYLLACLN